ncbi:MAG: hypothetical protein KJI69_01095 [Patescibacteria group bacterium]|nr:hypothetical protein [Patescibacteria group bacterium]
MPQINLDAPISWYENRKLSLVEGLTLRKELKPVFFLETGPIREEDELGRLPVSLIIRERESNKSLLAVSFIEFIESSELTWISVPISALLEKDIQTLISAGIVSLSSLEIGIVDGSDEVYFDIKLQNPTMERLSRILEARCSLKEASAVFVIENPLFS